VLQAAQVNTGHEWFVLKWTDSIDRKHFLDAKTPGMISIFNWL